MKKSNKIIIGVVAIVAIIAILLGVYFINAPKATKGTKAVSVEVVNQAGESKIYEANTDAEYLKQLMDELKESTDFSYDGEDGEYGLFISTINGETADYNVDQSYWAIYVNGEYGSYGADSQTVSDGDQFKFAYEISEY